VIQTSNEPEVAALVPLPPSPTELASKDLDPSDSAERQIVLLDESKIVDPLLVAKPSKVEQTPISALLASIERGFRFPDFPPLPALAIVDEGEDESLHIPEACVAETRADIRALNIRPKSNSREGKDSDRLVLIEMQVNR